MSKSLRFCTLLLVTLSAGLKTTPVGGANGGWVFETVHQLQTQAGCRALVRLAGLAFDLQNRPVVGWTESNACGSQSAVRWSRRQNGAWAQNTMTQPGFGGIRATEPDLALSPAGVPFYALGYPSLYIYGGAWVGAHIVDLEAQPTGPGDNVRAIDSYQSCLAAYPAFAISFRPGSATPELLVGTRCQYTGWLARNGETVHGAPPFLAAAGTDGEYHSIDYATTAGGSHVTYYAERGGANYGAFYSNAPGQEVGLAVPHRNRRAETSIAVGPDGRIHVAIGGVPLCGNSFEGGLLYATSLDGVTWSKAFVDTVSGRNPSIEVDANGQPHIAYWRFAGEVRLASPGVATWSSTPVYTAATNVGITNVRLAHDSSNLPHILFFNPDIQELQIASGAAPALPPALVNPDDQTSISGTSVSLQIQTSGPDDGPFTYSACNLPPGLSIDESSGIIGGTITATTGSEYSVTVTASGPTGSSAATFVWRIRSNAGPLLTNPGDQANADGDDVSLQLSASDPDGDSLTYEVSGLPPELAVNPSTGAISGKLPFSVGGSYDVTASVSDGTASDSVTFRWVVTNTNGAPTATPSSAGTNEDTPVTLSLAGTDPDGDHLTFHLVDEPAHGTVSLSGNAATYTPAANYHGPDQFSFLVNDGSDESDVAVVGLTVTAVNDAPVVGADRAMTPEDVAVTFDVRGNDTDVDGDTLSVAAVTQGSKGSVVRNADGTLTYSPSPNASGPDSFSYTVEDGLTGAASGQVDILITPIDDPPLAADGSAATPEDTAVQITLAGSDVDTADLIFALSTGPSLGTVGAVTANQLVYTPASNFSGADTFSFTVSDGNTTAFGVVRITVTPVNDPPALAPLGSKSVAASQTLAFALSATDPDGTGLVFTATGLPDGAALDPLTGAFGWTPGSAQVGTHTLTFRVADQGGLSDSETIDISVLGSNQAPVCTGVSPSVAEIWPPNHRQQIVVAILGVTDPDQDVVTIAITRILQDEPTDTMGDGSTAIDGGIIGTSRAWVRAERAGTPRVPGNGRVYEIFFVATDPDGANCASSVTVGVPHDRGKKGPAVDDGIRYDSTVPRGPRVY